MKNFAIAVLILTGCAIFAGCATSSHKVTGTLHPGTSADNVKVYAIMPDQAKVVGTVKVVSYAGMTMEQARDNAMVKLKAEAAKLGANGIVPEFQDADVLSGVELDGKAVFISQ